MAEKFSDYFTLSQRYLDAAHAAMRRMMEQYLRDQCLPAEAQAIEYMRHDCESMLGYALMLHHACRSSGGGEGI